MFKAIDQTILSALSGTPWADAASRACAGALLVVTPLCMVVDLVRLKIGVFALLSGFIFMALAFSVRSKKAWLLPGFLHRAVRAAAITVLLVSILLLFVFGGYLGLLSVLQAFLLTTAFYLYKAARPGAELT